jgi:hypothetical protein
MEFLKINLETFKITPLLSNIDEEINIECQIESLHTHEIKLNTNIKVK